LTSTIAEKQKEVRKGLFFSEEELSALKLNAIPKHVAIIMDGNRRWAEKRHLPIQVGHARGADQLKTIVEAAMELGLKTLTVYSFSTENRKRSPREVQLLFTLFKKYLIKERDEMKSNGIRLDTIGDLSLFPKDLQETLELSKKMTKKETRFNLVLAVNYGARDEIKRAVQKMLRNQKSIQDHDVTEELIESYLDTAKWSDPELLIRTSGEFRLSNFLLWQISYTEIYFTDVFWPDFTPKHLHKAIQNYQHREIRRGL